MDDPPPVAASTLEKLCRGRETIAYLYRFYTSHQDQYADLGEIADRLKDLLHILQTVYDTLPTRTWQLDEQTLAQKIEESIADCDDVIEELQDEVQKSKKDPIDNIPITIKGKSRRLPYPFRESTLKKLDEDITDLSTNLSTTLQTLQSGENHSFEKEEEAVACPVHLGKRKRSIDQHGHHYGNINIDGRAQVHIGDTVVQNDTRELEDLVKNAQARELSASVKQWLRAPDATIDYNAACAKRHKDTGKWFVQSSTFTIWLQQSNSFLWLNGFAGCGKSVLCSTAIQYTFRHSCSQPESAVAFFFFTFNDESKREASSMLRALLLQLSGQIAGLDTDLYQLNKLYNDGMPPVPVLLEYLQNAVKRCRHVYLLLDALDESPEDTSRVEVLSVVDTIQTWELPGLHLLVTSRNVEDIRASLQTHTCEVVPLRNDDVDNDILQYVSHQVEHDRQLQRWRSDRETIIQSLAQRANGVFRWVDCQLQPLRQCPKSKYDLNECLKQLPRSLDETYERMLVEIAHNCRERAKYVLTLLCFAVRPLTVAEVIDAIAIDADDGQRYDPDRRLDNSDDLLRICPGFIEVIPHSLNKNLPSSDSTSIVRLAHFSVQEYLLSTRIRYGEAASFAMLESTGHLQICKACLIYLCHPDFLSQALTPTLVENYPLAPFAAEFWHHHYRLVDNCKATELDSWTISLLQSTERRERWLRLYDPEKPYAGIVYDRELSSYETSTYYTSYFGLDRVLAQILSIPTVDVNASGDVFGRSLPAASRGGYEKVVRMLLDAGANVNAQDGFQGTALHKASQKGNEKVVQMLLNAGAKVNIQDEFQDTALHIVSSTGCGKVVQALLDAGADVNAQDKDNGTALHNASDSGHAEVVQLLLNAGADINAQDNSDRTALQRAADSGHVEVVHLLLNAGADINAQDNFDRTTLQRAYGQNHRHVVQILWQRGATIHQLISRDDVLADEEV